MFLIKLLAMHGPRWRKIVNAFNNRYQRRYTQPMLRNRYQRMTRKSNGRKICLHCGQIVAGHSCPYKLPPPLSDDAKDDQSVFEVDADDAKDDQCVSEVDVNASEVNDFDVAYIDTDDKKIEQYDVDTVYWCFNGDTDLDIKDLKMSPWNVDNWSNSTTSFVFPQVLQSS